MTLIAKRPGLFVFTFGLVVALLWSFLIFPRLSAIDQWFDLNGYGELAEHILRGDGYSYGYGPTIRRPPLYPYLLAGILALCGFDPAHRQASYTPVFVAQSFMAGFTCLIVFTLGRRLFGLRAGLLAGVLCAVWPQCLRYVAAIDVECTLTLLVACVGLAMDSAYRAPGWRTGLALGAVCGLACLAKPILLLYPLLVALPLLMAGHRPTPRRRAASCAGVLAGTALICLPWVARNIAVTQGRFASISSNASGEYLRGFVVARPDYFALRKPFSGNWDLDANAYEDAILRAHGASFMVTIAGKAVPPLEQPVDALLAKERIENHVALRRAMGHPLELVRKFVIQLFTFWYLVETKAKSLLVGLFAVLALAGAALGCLHARRAGVRVAPVLATVLYFNVVYALTLAFARYSMPVFPLLLVLAANGVLGGFQTARGASPAPDQAALA